MTTASDKVLITTEFMTAEWKERVKQFRKEWHQMYSDISNQETPRYNAGGEKIVDKRPDGYDYIKEHFMREMLTMHFPGWSWEMAAPLHFLGGEWVVAQGHLIILDEHLLAFGVVPPLRRFYGVDAVRIQYKRDSTHEPGNIVDVGDNCKSAGTSALKAAINRLTNIGDDVYKKRGDMDGSGSLEDMLVTSQGGAAFAIFLKEKNILPSDAFRVLGVKSLSEITNHKEASEKIKEWIEQGKPK